MRTNGALLIAIAALSCSAAEEPAPVSEKVYVVCGGSETITIYYVAGDSIRADAMTLGNAPGSDMVVAGAVGYVVNSGFTGTPSVSYLDLANDVVMSEWALPAGSSPFGCALAGGRLWVSLRSQDRLYALDPSTGAPLDSVNVGTGPLGLLSVNDVLYVACSGVDSAFNYNDGWVWRVQGATGQVLDSLKVGLNVQRLGVSGTGRLLALCTGDYGSATGMLYSFETDFSLPDSAVIGSYPAAMQVKNSTVYVAGVVFDPSSSWGEYTLRRYDASNLTLVDSVRVDSTSGGVAVGDDGRMYVTVSDYTGGGNRLVVLLGDSVVTQHSLGTAVGADFAAYRP